jgi:hypothetical protein
MLAETAQSHEGKKQGQAYDRNVSVHDRVTALD